MSESDEASAGPSVHDEKREKYAGRWVKSSKYEVPKHLRKRYWSSWEEMKLVELWRLHSAEITTLQTNIPIFRTVSESMRQWGFHVNAQECRRKIISMKNKYIAERRRMELAETNKSDWKLYPLVHCLLSPRIKNPDLTHEIKIVNQLLAKMPKQKPVHLNPQHGFPDTSKKLTVPVKSGFPIYASAMPFVTAQPVPTFHTLTPRHTLPTVPVGMPSYRAVPTTTPEAPHVPKQQHSRPLPITQANAVPSLSPAPSTAAVTTIAPAVEPSTSSVTSSATAATSQPAIATASAPSTDPPSRPKRAYNWRIPIHIPPPADGVSYVLSHHFTKPGLEQLRADNCRLAELRDNSLRRLEIEEKEYTYLESFLRSWQAQQEHVLQRLQCNSAGAQ